MQRLYFADVNTFSDEDFRTIFSKSVKSRASKICHIFRTKTGRALIFVLDDRYKMALAILLSLKASSMFPDREFGLKNGPKSEFSEKDEKSCKSRTFVRIAIFSFSMCFKHKNTFLIFEWIRAFSIYWPWKNAPQFYDLIGGHVKGLEFESLFFSCSWIDFRNCHTNSKAKNYFFTVLFQIEIALGTLSP